MNISGLVLFKEFFKSNISNVLQNNKSKLNAQNLALFKETFSTRKYRYRKTLCSGHFKTGTTLIYE